MGLKEAFESLLRMGKSGRELGDPPVSIVLLLREGSFPRLEQLRELAGRAFGAIFSGDIAARHSIYQRGVIFTLANVGSHNLSFLFRTTPYGDHSKEADDFEKALHRADQRQLWAEHRAFIAIDYVKGDVDIDSQYVVLARLCSELYNANCMGLYLPRENALILGDENARAQLSKIIAHRDVDVT